MKKVKKYPNVVIVGRTNVGKSTLFNRIAQQTRSIVLEKEGITRDYLEETIFWENKPFNIIDTGGISLKKQEDSILEKVRQNVLNVVEKSALILFVCDGKNGLTQEDMHLAKILHKTKKPLVLIINKADNKKAIEEHMHDFYALGIKDILCISAIHGQGVLDLLEKIHEIIPQSTEDQVVEKPSYKVVIIGKPNVGKSSLMNILVKQERSIVSELAGTTREAISENLYFLENLVQITDTAGVRKKRKIKETVETLMVKSSLHAIREADIIILIVNAAEHHLSDQELKLLFYTVENKKSIIIACNKTDLITEDQRKFLEHNLKEYDFILKKIPIIWISCKTKKNVDKVFREISKIQTRLAQTFDSLEVDELLKGYFVQKPMFHKTQPLLLKSVSVLEGKIPTFVLKVNFPQWFGNTQLGFIENVLRKHYNLKGCPIKFIIKKG
jgi:GTP-binding protein